MICLCLATVQPWHLKHITQLVSVFESLTSDSEGCHICSLPRRQSIPLLPSSNQHAVSQLEIFKKIQQLAHKSRKVDSNLPLSLSQDIASSSVLWVDSNNINSQGYRGLGWEHRKAAEKRMVAECIECVPLLRTWHLLSHWDLTAMRRVLRAPFTLSVKNLDSNN